MRNTQAPRGDLGIKLRLVIFMAVSHRHKTAPQAELCGLSKDGRQSLGGLWLPTSHGKTTRVSVRLILHRALRQIKEILEAKFPRVIFTKAPYARISHTPNTAIAAFERTAVTKCNTDPRFAHQTGHECHCHWCSGHGGKQRPSERRQKAGRKNKSKEQQLQ